MAAARPLNVLLITSDQQRWDTLGCINPRIRTPHLDALAARGILYDNAYTCNPVCTPARVSLLTGQYPSRHGCYTIGTALPDDYPTIPAALRQAGYFTALCGKAHFTPCTNAPLGEVPGIEAPPKSFDMEFFKNWAGPYFGFEHARLSIAHTNERNAAGMHYGLWLRRQGVDPARFFGTGKYEDFGTWDLPEELHNSRWTADETIAALDVARTRRRPFFIWSSFQDPHNPCVVPRPWDSMYRPADMPEYAYRPGEFDDKPPFYAAYHEQRPQLGDPELDTSKNWYCVRGLTRMNPRATRELCANYYGMVSLMDHHIGRVLAALEANGQVHNTVVIFTTDHGDYLGNHGLWWKGLPAYDDAQRVPFIVAHPHCTTPGARSNAIQSLVDIGPTALALAGQPRGPELQGIVQTAPWINAAFGARAEALIEYRPTESPFMQLTLVNERWKCVAYHQHPYGELYDRSNDPDQYHNLWNDPAHTAIKTELLRQMPAAQFGHQGPLRPRLAWA
jgi:arylsulfatase A-like enzyme